MEKDFIKEAKALRKEYEEMIVPKMNHILQENCEKIHKRYTKGISKRNSEARVDGTFVKEIQGRYYYVDCGSPSYHDFKTIGPEYHCYMVSQDQSGIWSVCFCTHGITEFYTPKFWKSYKELFEDSEEGTDLIKIYYQENGTKRLRLRDGKEKKEDAHSEKCLVEEGVLEGVRLSIDTVVFNSIKEMSEDILGEATDELKDLKSGMFEIMNHAVDE